MNKLCWLLLLLPLMVTAQEDTPDLILQNVIITPKSDMVMEFEAKLAAHNKAYHANAEHGCRVYSISSGPNIGKYVWVMGPTPWAALDSRPGAGDHDKDWNEVTKMCESNAHGTFWQFDQKNSFFPADFKLGKMQLMYVDIKRGHSSDVTYLMKAVHEVSSKHYTDDPYGVYWNRTGSTKSGRDMAVVWFFENWSWMGEDNDWEEKFDMEKGDGAWDRWMDDWRDATNGTETEFWVHRPDLSGLPADVVVAERQ